MDLDGLETMTVLARTSSDLPIPTGILVAVKKTICYLPVEATVANNLGFPTSKVFIVAEFLSLSQPCF
jgi:hypothetical protein